MCHEWSSVSSPLLLALGAFVLGSALSLDAGAQSLEPIRYTLRFPEPHTHYVEVEAVYPTGRRPELDLKMAVWTPGSYLVREYSRHVEDLAAFGPDGASLAVTKTRKNRWRVATQGAAAVTVRYRVYAREMKVQTNWVEAGFAMLNGAPTFVTLLEKATRPHEVRLELPAGWKTSATALAKAPDGAPHHYVSPDYDTLVDSPLVAGSPAVYEFEVSGTSHLLVNEGEDGVWDGKRAASDVERIVRAAERLWGSLPYPRYVFLNMITGQGGGLEHKDSTLLMTHRWATTSRSDYVGWLGLVSHEFFHAWNVKRLRPVELGPFDYENEVYTGNLWVSEGFTDYYGDLVVRRAGLSSDDEYLNELSNLIKGLQTTPGRLVQSASEASYDAWIRQYRPDENSPNVSISYYTKGAVVAFLLDTKIRQATAGRRSLDDLMRLAYARFAGPRGFTTAEFRATASEVAGVDLGALVCRGRRRHGGGRLLAGAGLAGSPFQARVSGGQPRQGLARPDHAQRERTPPRHAGAPRYAGLRGGFQRGRRDPGDRQLPGAGGSTADATRAVSSRPEGDRARGAAG